MRVRSLSYVVLSLALLAGAMGGAWADSGGNGDTTTLYRWVDAQGVIHFSDTPQPGAEKMQVAPAQTFPSTPVAGSELAKPAATAAVYETCAIEVPTAEQSFYAPEAVGVSVRLVPDLRDGDQVSVSVDGKDLSSVDGSALDFQVGSPDRGAHTVRAVVRDANGQTLCASMAVTFYVQRPSLLSPQSPAESHGVIPPRH
jgi:hypothetical protein